MDFDSVQPIISGLVGGSIAMWLTTKWMRWVPEVFRRKSAGTLLEEHHSAVVIADCLFFVGLLVGLALYQFAGFERNDWRPIVLGFGLASVGPLCSLLVVSLVTRRNPKEAFVAFAISQRTPLVLIYGLLVLGAITFFATIAALFR
jgi:hypothetical protein